MKRFFILHFRDVLCFNLQYVPVRMCMWLVAVGVPSGCRRPHNDVKSLFLQYVMQTCFSPYSLISLGRWEWACFWAEVFWTEISQGKACKCKACCFRLLRCHTAKVCSFYGCFLCGWQYFTRANGVFCRLSGGAGWCVLAVLAFWKTVFRRVKGCVSGCNRTLLTALKVFRRMLENVVLQFSRT